MASTKIINVLKDDKFEEILDLFRNTPAKEVIFVLPKTSKAFKNEGHFVILENEARKSNKKVSLLCSNSDTNKLAGKYNFDVLLAKEDNSNPLIKTVNQIDSEKSGGVDDEIEDEEEVTEENELESEHVHEEVPDEEEEPEKSEDEPFSASAAMYQENDDENDE